MAEEKETKKIEEKTEETKVEDKEIKKEKKSRKERTGILYVKTTKNNTLLNVTDLSGNSIAKASGGQSTKQSRLKSSPTVAMFSAKKIAEEIKELGITNLYIRVKAKTGSPSVGSASHAIIKVLSRDGIKVLNIMEITKQPRGGPKQKGGRRGRRV
jgi:small subunit ribosomal protein S11